MDVQDSTKLGQSPPSASGLPATLQLSVLTPCVGQQTLNKVNSYTYSGTVGDFTVVNLFVIVEDDEDSWELQVINFDQSPSRCYGVTIYRLDQPAGSPVGNYCLWDGSSKDCSAGQATVA